jgi:surface antigen
MCKLKFLIAAILAGSLVACAANPNSPPTVIKQQVGTSVSSEPATVTAATTNQTTLDTLLSGTIGKSMEEQDRINTQQALINIPMGQEAVWTNANTKIAYAVIPVNEYRSGSAFCRQAQIIIGNAKQTTYITICKSTDGKWYVKQ